MRLIVGFDLQLQVAPAITTPLTQTATSLVYRRGANGPFVTSSNTVWLSAYGAFSTAPLAFSSVFTSITNAAGVDVTSAVTVLDGNGLATTSAVSTTYQVRRVPAALRA